MALNTPNMNLILSVVGVDSGLTWELNTNSNTSVTDQHNHSPGYGVQIPPSGLNINADLPFNINNATNLRTVRFNNLSNTLSVGSGVDTNCVYVANGNLYFNDGLGDPPIQLTLGGAVNSTSTGITSGTASASFVSSVLVVNANTNTPANIQAGSILLGNNVSGSKFLTLSPPAAMAANLTLTLPSIPAQTNIMSMDTSGNIAANVNVDNSTLVLTSNTLSVATGGITSTQIAAATVANTNMAQRPLNGSAGSGSFTTTSTTPVQITNFALSQITSGNPVMVTMFSTTTAGSGSIGIGHATGPCSAVITLTRNGAAIGVYQLDTSGPSLFIPSSSVVFYDNILSAGSYTYALEMNITTTGTTAFCFNSRMLTREIY